MSLYLVALTICAQRGNRRAEVFGDDSDRLVYLRLMRDACEKHGTFIWGYALMAQPCSSRRRSGAVRIRSPKTIKDAHGDYSKYFNTKYGLVGHAWQGRFKSFPMDWDYCRNAIRYVERNPVRAGLVVSAEDYLGPAPQPAAACATTRCCPAIVRCLEEFADWSEWLRDPKTEKANET